MTLNESLRFADVDSTVKRAFLRAPEKVLLGAQVRLHKWTNRPLLGGVGITPSWSFVESARLPSGAIAEGFSVAEERSARLGRTHRDYAKVRAAVSGQFRNSMTDLGAALARVLKVDVEVRVDPV